MSLRTLGEPTALLDLNDDCLLHVLEYLSIAETFTLIGSVSSRLDTIAYQRIGMCKSLSLSARNLPDYSRELYEIIGRNLRSLILSVGYLIPTEKVLYYLKPLCSGALQGAKLVQLTINYVNFDQEYLDCIDGLEPKLTHLDLSFCLLTDAILSPLLEHCTKLQHLRIIANYTLCGKSLLNLQTRHLRLLEIEVHEDMTFEPEAFFSLNPTLRIIVHTKGRATKTEYTKKSKERNTF